MDAFTFLKYWRASGGEPRLPSPPPPPPPPLPAASEITNHDEGPFIDLEFIHHHSPHLHSSDSEEDDSHISFTLSPSTNNHSNSNMEDLHFDPSSFLLNSNSNSNPPPPSPPTPPPPPTPFTASFLKSATKFRVFMLGLKKPKPNSTQHGKLCTVKFKVEQVPTQSFFTSKPRASSDNKHESLTHAHSDEKRSMYKYLRIMKPLYIRVSRSRYYDKLNQEEDGGSDLAVEGTKHLGKSRSASDAVLVSSGRRDDSLLQHHDGIQGAILHCKRSFNATTECESSQLPRSVSNPLHDT